MIQFGEYILDSQQARLLKRHNHEGVPIEPKLFELLAFFIARPNTTLSRTQLLEQVWTGTLVTDNAVNKMVGNLRKVLGDDAKQPRYIQTVPKRGYRFVCEVTPYKPSDSKLTACQPNNTLQEQLISNVTSHNKTRLNTVRLSVLVGVVVLFLLFMGLKDRLLEPSSPQGYSQALTREQGVESSPHLHPDNIHLYYLKKNLQEQYVLWVKNTQTARTQQINLNHPMSKIVAVTQSAEDGQTVFIFVDKTPAACGVYMVTLVQPSTIKHPHATPKKLLDCKNKPRIKDIDYHAQQHAIYYAAQPQNFWPNHIYKYDIASQTHTLLPQGEPKGWGHHGIDISPDGKKLLIMSTDTDQQTQLLSLNLQSQKITHGKKFNRPVQEAIWAHDSTHIYYHDSSSLQRIMQSELNGERPRVLVSTSQTLSRRMLRAPDNKNILFATQQSNLNNRWVAERSGDSPINNSTVADTSPAFFHHKAQYLFTSKRSGKLQFYIGDERSGAVDVISQLEASYSRAIMAISPDDKVMLFSIDNKVYTLPLHDDEERASLFTLKDAKLIYTGKGPIISLDWLGLTGAAITSVEAGIPKLVAIDLLGQRITLSQEDKWVYGLTDATQPEQVFLVSKYRDGLYRADLTNPDKLLKVDMALPSEFYSIKIDHGVLYFVVPENNKEYLHAIPLNGGAASKYSLNNYLDYDVSGKRMMVSDISSPEGDVHRTVL